MGSLSKLSHRTTEGDVKGNVRWSVQRCHMKGSSDGGGASSTAWVHMESPQGQLCRRRRQFPGGGENPATAVMQLRVSSFFTRLPDKDL